MDREKNLRNLQLNLVRRMESGLRLGSLRRLSCGLAGWDLNQYRSRLRLKMKARDLEDKMMSWMKYA